MLKKKETSDICVRINPELNQRFRHVILATKGTEKGGLYQSMEEAIDGDGIGIIRNF